MSYLLDTNICIHLFKGHEYLVGKIEAAGINSCYLSEITILELMLVWKIAQLVVAQTTVKI